MPDMGSSRDVGRRQKRSDQKSIRLVGGGQRAGRLQAPKRNLALIFAPWVLASLLFLPHRELWELEVSNPSMCVILWPSRENVF